MESERGSSLGQKSESLAFDSQKTRQPAARFSEFIDLWWGRCTPLYLHWICLVLKAGCFLFRFTCWHRWGCPLSAYATMSMLPFEPRVLETRGRGNILQPSLQTGLNTTLAAYRRSRDAEWLADCAHWDRSPRKPVMVGAGSNQFHRANPFRNFVSQLRNTATTKNYGNLQLDHKYAKVITF